MMNTKMADRIYTFLDSAAVDDSQENKASLPTDIKEIVLIMSAFRMTILRFYRTCHLQFLKGKFLLSLVKVVVGRRYCETSSKAIIGVRRKDFFGQQDLVGC